jgi:hypothetical protein
VITEPKAIFAVTPNHAFVTKVWLGAYWYGFGHDSYFLSLTFYRGFICIRLRLPYVVSDAEVAWTNSLAGS